MDNKKYVVMVRYHGTNVDYVIHRSFVTGFDNAIMLYLDLYRKWGAVKGTEGSLSTLTMLFIVRSLLVLIMLSCFIWTYTASGVRSRAPRVACPSMLLRTRLLRTGTMVAPIR